MEYIGTIFVAVTNIVIGYVWGRIVERRKGSPMPEDTVLFNKGVEEGRRLEKEDEKEIRTLAERLAEAVLFEWDNVVEIAKHTATAIEEWRWKK